MTPGVIEGANTLMRGNGDGIGDLHVLRGTFDGWPCFASAWFPTPVELAALNAGAPVIVGIISNDGMPPIVVSVKDEREAS